MSKKLSKQDQEIRERERANFEKYTIDSIDDLRDRGYKIDDAFQTYDGNFKSIGESLKKIQEFANETKGSLDDHEEIMDSLCEKVEGFDVGTQIIRRDYLQGPITLGEEINSLRASLDTAFERIRELEQGLEASGWHKVKYTQHVDKWERRGFWSRLFERE